ncbi:MAG: class I SAM-dependent RNA methyltransferase [Bauldia sp.]
MTEQAVIRDVGHAGDGVAETEGGRVFVPLTLPGERVEFERQGERGTLLTVLSPSAERQEPPCRHFGACGGCALQHWHQQPYLAWKSEQVAAALAQRGLAAPIRPIIPANPGDRRRTVLTALRRVGGAILGFARRSSNEVVAIEECPVTAPAIVTAFPTIRQIAATVLGPGERAQVAVTLTDVGLDVSIEADRLASADSAALLRFASVPSLARLTVAGETIFQTREPVLAVGQSYLHPAPGGFLQATAPAEAALAAAVDEAAGENGPVADLFCGVGTFTLRLAKRTPVLAMDSDPAALAALQKATHRARGIKAVTARRRDLMRSPPTPTELRGFAAVVFDPPRAGARRLAEELAQSTVPRIAAVSCNPATFARDARILVDGGYALSWVQPVDQFLFSPHIELAAAFQR